MVWGHEVTGRDKNGDRTTLTVSRADWMRTAYGQQPPPEPFIPEYLQSVWINWWRLNGRRPASDSVCPIPYCEIESFSRLTNECFTPDDIRLIEAMDNAYISQVGEERKTMAEEARRKQEMAAATTSRRK